MTWNLMWKYDISCDILQPFFTLNCDNAYPRAILYFMLCSDGYPIAAKQTLWYVNSRRYQVSECELSSNTSEHGTRETKNDM